MRKIILMDKTELEVRNLVSIGNELSITFEECEDINKLISIYSPSSERYNESNLREFTIKSEDDKIEGVHQGYTKFISVTSDGINCTVKIEKENELITRIEKQDEIIAKLLLLAARKEE